MQIRVVTDQPWEVSTDVLVVPVVGELEFTGAYDELDRRSGGELRALQAFGELRDRRYGTALGASGELPARRLLVVSAGHAEDLDRETVRKFAARAIRRLINRDVKAMAVWLDPLADSLGGDVALVADVVARGVVEGGFEPKTIYREDSDAAPPVLDELVLIAPGGDATALAKAAERGRIIGEGANVARRLSNRAANDVTPAGPGRRGGRDRHGQRAHDRRRRREARGRAGHGHVPRRGAGERQQAADDRDAVGRRRGEGRPWPAPRDCRQGRVLRLGRKSASSRATGWKR